MWRGERPERPAPDAPGISRHTLHTKLKKKNIHRGSVLTAPTEHLIGGDTTAE